MNIRIYLAAKYEVRVPTTMLYAEARVFGVPYPLRNGWLQEYGEVEITGDVAKKLLVALEKSNSPLAKKGISVLNKAWIELKRIPGANDSDFLSSKAWKRLRLMALNKHGRRCQCCGSSPETGAVLNVDHVLPRKLFPELALQLSNLQVLCGDCNEGKGNWDMTDMRKKEHSS